ncbi:MAG: hypothetical protein M1820_000355 [Bogoriella megaspora]|nr:MAG: hypothetical protein M1820_000355 [Bogoriella megaspora]
MPPRTKLAIPTNAPLPHNHRLPSVSRHVFKTLSKLSRPSLLDLALDWLEETNIHNCAPYILAPNAEEEEGEDAPYLPGRSLEEVREIYSDLQARKGSKREVIDRIIEGDWRHGLTLFQVAMAETRYIIDRPTSQRWTALRLTKLKTSSTDKTTSVTDDNSRSTLPRFHVSTFLNSLQHELAPVTKAHYYLTRPTSTLPLTFLRILIHDSPYNTQRSVYATHPTNQPFSRSLFFAFPHGSPYIYISQPTLGGTSTTTATESTSLRSVIIDAVPKALSRPHARYKLEPTSLSTKSLHALLDMRGPDGKGSAQGGWGIFTDLDEVGSALDYRDERAKEREKKRKAVLEAEEEGKENEGATDGSLRKRNLPILGRQPSPRAKRRKLVAEGRFGKSGMPEDGKGIERFDVRLDDPFPVISAKGDVEEAAKASERNESRSGHDEAATKKKGRKARPSMLDKSVTEVDEDTGQTDLTITQDGEWTPDVRLSFQGAHVFAGIRQLVEKGVIDGKRMPGWMTGEASVSIGVVRDGRIRIQGNGLV